MTIDTRFREMPGPGVYRGVVGPHYHGWPAASSSRLRKPGQGLTPKHLKHDLDHPDSFSSKAAEFGTLGHVLVLQPELYEELYALAPPGRRGTNAYNAVQAAVKASRPFATIVKAADVERARAAKKAIEEHPTASLLFEGAETELTLVWDEPVELGDGEVVQVRCKARIDSMLDGITDLKFTARIEDDSIGRVYEDKRYDLQAAHYLRGAYALADELADLGYTIPQVQPFGFCFVEDKAPHDIKIRYPNSAHLANADDELEVLLQIWAECQRAGVWPGSPPFPDEVQTRPWFTSGAQVRIAGLHGFLEQLPAVRS